MKLKELRISRKDYGADEGKFYGKATFAGDRGEIALVLNEHHIEQIFLTCADSIEEVAKAAARFLHIEVQNQRALSLENKGGVGE